MTRKLKLILLSLVLAIPGTVLAQLEEIIVTAQKREQSLQDVSVTVAAFSGDQIQQLRINNMVDLTSIVPGLDVTNSIGGTNPRISLRGVGLNDFNPNNNPSVGVYVDEVFQVSPATLGFMMFDVERVEVLKGPQGTLYGRNSNGGAINILTVKPSAETNGYAKLGYGDYETLEVEGAAGGAISDSVFGRLSVRYRDQGETFYNGEQTGENYGSSSALGIRAQIGGESASGWSSNLKVEYSTDEGPRHPSKSDPILSLDGFGTPRCAAALAGTNDRTTCDDALGFLTPGSAGLLIADDTADPWLRTEPFAASKPTDTDVKSTAVTLNIAKDFDEISFTSITGYLQNERLYSEGNISEVEAAGIFRDEELDAFSQELRLDGSSGMADWVTGVFFSRDDVTSINDLFLTDLFLTDAFWTVDQQTTTAAVFANVDWNLTEKVRLSTGLRYSWEEKKFKGGTTDQNTNGTSLIVGGPGSFVLSDVDDKISQNDLSWRLGIDYSPTENWMLYGNISTGFKSGGFFGDLTFSNEELAPYDPEEIIAYEAGFKSTLGGGTVQLNGAAFYYDYTDIQSQVPSALSLQFTNVPSADVRGLEAELQWQPVDAFYLSGGFAYLDTEMSAFGLIPAGNKLPNAPELQYNAIARYEFSISTNYALAIQGDLKYSDSMFREGTNDIRGQTASYTVYNARIAFLEQDGRWELALWGRNLGDEVYSEQIFVTDTTGVATTYFGAPRTYGLSFQWNYE